MQRDTVRNRRGKSIGRQKIQVCRYVLFLAWLLNKFARIFSEDISASQQKMDNTIMKTLSILSVCMCISALPCPAQFRSPENMSGTGQEQVMQKDTADHAAEGNQPRDTTLLKEKVWTLKDCIDYALKENISLKQSRLSGQSAEIDLKTSKSALFPSLSFSTSHSIINRPYQ